MGSKVIVIATDKGGDGKTTLNILLSSYICNYKLKEGENALLIDLDPQANASSYYIEMVHDPYSDVGGKKPARHPDADEIEGWDGVSSSADIFTGEDLFPYPTRLNNLSVLPAYASKLEDVERVTKQDVASLVHDRFKSKIEQLKNYYSYIFIDTRPSKGPLTTAAIKACTDLIIPTKMEAWSIEGIYGMLQVWKQETYSRPSDNPIKLVGFLPNYVLNESLHKDFLEEIRATDGIKDYVLPVELKKRAAYSRLIAETSDSGEIPKFFYELSAQDPARLEAENVCGTIYERIMT